MSIPHPSDFSILVGNLQYQNDIIALICILELYAIHALEELENQNREILDLLGKSIKK
jgi:hypothetical protein